MEEVPVKEVKKEEKLIRKPKKVEEEVKPEVKVELTKALHQDVQQVAKNFRGIANAASPMIRNYLKLAKLSVGNQDQLLLVLPDEVSAGVVGSEAHKEEIQRIIEEKTGKTMMVEVRQVEEGRRFEESFVDIEKIVHMDLTIEE